MIEDLQEDSTTYKVVINHEEQYSIWPSYRDNPAGWNDCGVQGPKAECLEYIGRVWTDMRPLSLRRHMAEAAAARADVASSPIDEEDLAIDPLVERLSAGSHPVAASRCGGSVETFRECVERGYLHVRFIETGTELGVRLDAAENQRIGAAVSARASKVQVMGSLTLNDVPVRCVAEIDLANFEGAGRLEIVKGD